MPEWFLHLAEGGALLALSAWSARLQARSAKVHELELRVVTLETAAKGQDAAIARIEEAVKNVSERMLRREDLGLIRTAAKS